jgi:hypothetical protein
MSSEHYFKLLCIPQDGIPFEATGCGARASLQSIENDQYIIDLVRCEFGDEIIPSRPFHINPDLSTFNKVWDGVEKIIEDMWSSNNPEKNIRVFVSKNEHLYNYNKYVKGGGYRPKGNIYIWICRNDYSIYEPLEQKHRKIIETCS